MVAHLLHVVHAVVRAERDAHPLLEGAIHHAHARDGAAVPVVERVVDEGAQRGGRVALGRRHLGDDLLEQGGDAQPFLGADEQHVLGPAAEEPHDFGAPLFGLGAGQVDLVEDRDDLEPGLHGEEQVRQRLRLDALRGVNDEDGPLAGGKRPRHLVREVHVPGGVDEVQLVRLAALRRVGHAHGVQLDGDAALALEVQRIEHLGLHLALLEHAGGLDQAVGERRLAVIDVGDDAEVADAALVHGTCG